MTSLTMSDFVGFARLLVLRLLKARQQGVLLCGIPALILIDCARSADGAGPSAKDLTGQNLGKSVKRC